MTTLRTVRDLRADRHVASIISTTCSTLEVSDRDVLSRSERFPVPVARWMVADMLIERFSPPFMAIARLLGWRSSRQVKCARYRVRFVAQHGTAHIRSKIAAIRRLQGFPPLTSTPTQAATAMENPPPTTDDEPNVELAAMIASLSPADHRFVHNVATVLSSRQHESFANAVRSGEAALKYVDNGGPHVLALASTRRAS